MAQNNTPFKKLLKNPWGAVSFAIVALYMLLAVGIEIYSVSCQMRDVRPVYDQALGEKFRKPDSRHLFGTDYQGRDVFFRAVAGTATAMKVGIVSGVIAVVLGVFFGTLAGYFGKFWDDLVVWLYSVFASMPSLLFILGFALLISRGFLPPALMNAVRGTAVCLHVEPGMLAVYMAIGLTGWVTLSRVIRAECMKLKKAPYVEAAKIAGVGSFRIICRHILPNLRHLVIIFFTLTFAGAVMLEVIVSYLGLGVQSAPSWGVMIADGQEKLWRGVYWEIGGATLFMFILVLALNLLGDAMRDAFDPKESRGR